MRCAGAVGGVPSGLDVAERSWEGIDDEGAGDDLIGELG